MFQYMKLNPEKIINSRYSILSGKDALKFLAKQFLFVVFMFYAVLFLAAATPFLQPHSLKIYIPGFIIFLLLAVRFVMLVISFLQYKNSSITFDEKSITINIDDNVVNFPNSSVEYLEITIFNNLIVHSSEKKQFFPLVCLNKEDSKKIINQFDDIEPLRTRVIKKVYEILDALVMALILAVHIIHFFIQNYYIPTGSMEDTLIKGDHLFAEKITYGPSIPRLLGMKSAIHLDFLAIRKVERGDIIIFQPPAPADEDKDYIKRCIAVEGDVFHIKDNHVYINGKKIEEPYIKGVTNYIDFADKNKIEGVVPKGKVIALGDNRENSSDSRFFGYLDVKRIKAKALVLYWNFGQIKNLDFSRFGLIK